MKDWMELTDQLSDMAHFNHITYSINPDSPSKDILKNFFASFSFLAINRGGGQIRKTKKAFMIMLFGLIIRFKLNIGGDQCSQINRGYQFSRKD